MEDHGVRTNCIEGVGACGMSLSLKSTPTGKGGVEGGGSLFKQVLIFQNFCAEETVQLLFLINN